MKILFRLLIFIRNYPFSSLLVTAIWILCFMDVPETPLDNVAFMDKWTHFAMYGTTCAVILGETLRRHRQRCSRAKLLVWAWLLPVLMSGLIEILQANCTGGRRSGEWLDFAANTVGATIGVAIGILLAEILSRRRKD